ncbi:hypothetical protein ANO11243_008810 [Dothideomycetidae sp. 11243]|nr:hypothetical protein ANO11243_008810 [fungal sp. No.11243]
MSVSIHPALPSNPVDRFDFGSRMDSTAAKFTAVNGSVLGKDTPKSFTFRPDPTANFAGRNSAVADHDMKDQPQSTQSGYVAESSSSRHTDETPDGQGYLDNITLANPKRKRSPEEITTAEEERRRPMSMASPLDIQKDAHVHSVLDVKTGEFSPRTVDSRDSERLHVSKLHDDFHDAITHQQRRTCRKRKKKCDEHKPTCLNCAKGSFKCEGYEEDKIVPGSVASNSRSRSSTHTFLASNLQPYPATRPVWPDHYDQYRAQNSPEARRSSEVFGASQREGWGKPSWPSDTSPSAPSPMKAITASRVDGARPEGFLNYSRDPPRLSHESLINAARLGTSIAPAAGSAGPSDHTVGSHSAQTLAPLTHPSPLEASRFRQRQRMLQGLPYHHFNDVQLMEDRNDCKGALERYNNAVRQSSGASEEECGRLFKAIVMPELRRLGPNEGRPSGNVGRYVVIEAPFTCEYGYNIHLDDDVVVEADCFIQDPCRVTIGKRTVIGPNVKIYGRILPTDMRARGGLRGLAIGAPVIIEDDCYIGGSCTIMAGVRIGRGSVIIAGTIVDEDVPSGVEYGGFPPKIIRGISVQTENSTHNPHRHDLDDLASLMMRDRGFTLTGR